MSARSLDLSSITIPRARKGEAAPFASVDAEAAVPSPPEQPQHHSSQLGQPTRRSSVPTDTEPRTTVSVRLTLSLQERLRLASFQTRRSKQDMIEEAISAYLSKLESES